MEKRRGQDLYIQVVGVEEYRVLKTEEMGGRCGMNGHRTRATTAVGVRQCVDCGVMVQYRAGSWWVVVRQSRRRGRSGDWVQQQLFQEE